MNKSLRRLVFLALLGLAGWATACGGGPPLRVKGDKDGLVVDVQTLGEYQTTVTRVRFSDAATGTVLWEVSAKSGEPQIHEFALKPGVNSSRIASAATGTLETVVPAGPETITLARGQVFRIEVWGKSGQPSSATFTF